MKKMALMSCLLLVLAGVRQLQAQGSFVEISGTILDEDSNRPIQACNIYVRNRDIGTVANSDGEFSIKIPSEHVDKNLVFSNIGYETYEVPIAQLEESGNTIKLTATIIVMEELVVREAENILRTALARIPDNYPLGPEMLTTFYRELIKRNNSYVDISQGILEVFKLPYHRAGRDLVKINKGFRSKDYKAQDTLVFKLLGGPHTMLLLDLVKNPGIVLEEEILEYYTYELSDIREFDGKRHYEISFQPKNENDIELYVGKIYIEEKTLAISQIEFGYPSKTVKEAGKNLVKSKPRLAKLTPLVVNYEVKFREFKSRWHLYYVRNELSMRCNWRKRLFNTTFHSVSEMVVTDRKLIEVQPFEKHELAGRQVFFSEEAGKYFDESFWENYTIIKPEDDIQKALMKINSRP